MITYILIDPRNMEVRYVGRTSNPKERLQGHMSDGYGSPIIKPELCKGAWINNIRAKGLKPILVPVAVGDLERVFYDALRIMRVRLWNVKVPQSRKLLEDLR